MKRDVVIGLEVHAALSTRTKLFCGCGAAFGAPPNTQICPVCTGTPGALPVLNRAAVEHALRAGLALGCEITPFSRFDRKNYFYPDLPKAYQISQLYLPLCREGRVEIEIEGQKKSVGIREIHMEEDAGKLIHDQGGATLVDYNRSGVPLIEIVTHPDFCSAAEVLGYLHKLREILLYLGACDCKMQEGSLRVDVNLSVKPAGGKTLGTRTETKNLNSFKAVGRAIEYETARQTALLEEGGAVTQETRRWDDGKGVSYAMRAKEDAHDYRYFPEPDLPPLAVDKAWLARVKKELPELAHEKRARYVREWGLSAAEAAAVTAHKNISDLFETAARGSGTPIEAARLVSGEVMRLLNTTDTPPESLSLDGGKLARLLVLLKEGKINRDTVKIVTEALFTEGADPDESIAKKGLLMVSDTGAVSAAVRAALAAHPAAAADYRAGKEKAFGFLMGQVMKSLKGAGNPDAVKKTLADLLDK